MNVPSAARWQTESYLALKRGEARSILKMQSIPAMPEPVPQPANLIAYRGVYA